MSDVKTTRERIRYVKGVLRDLRASIRETWADMSPRQRALQIGGTAYVCAFFVASLGTSILVSGYKAYDSQLSDGPNSKSKTEVAQLYRSLAVRINPFDSQLQLGLADKDGDGQSDALLGSTNGGRSWGIIMTGTNLRAAWAPVQADDSSIERALLDVVETTPQDDVTVTVFSMMFNHVISEGSGTAHMHVAGADGSWPDSQKDSGVATFTLTGQPDDQGGSASVNIPYSVIPGVDL